MPAAGQNGRAGLRVGPAVEAGAEDGRRLVGGGTVLGYHYVCCCCYVYMQLVLFVLREVQLRGKVVLAVRSGFVLANNKYARHERH